MSVLIDKRLHRRGLLKTLAALAVLAPAVGTRPGVVVARNGVVTPDGRAYTAYVPAATKAGQFYQYTCEFDASWVILKTFGYDVPFEEQLDIVGHDTSIEPYSEATADGIMIYGGDITKAFSGDYTYNLLARTTGSAMLPLFTHFGLKAEPARTREDIEATLNQGGLVWLKATVDFLPGEASTWVTPSGKTVPTVFGNDHAVVAMGYNDDGVVVRDVLGPTNTNWERSDEYDVPWDMFLSVFESQDSDGIGVFASETVQTSPPIQRVISIEPAETVNSIQPADPVQVCC